MEQPYKLQREKVMSYSITWLLAFSAGCTGSGVPVQEGELDIPALSVLSWDPTVPTQDPVNIKTSTLIGSGKSSQAGQGNGIGSFVDKEVLSPGLNAIVTRVGHSHAGGGKALVVLPDMDAAELPSELVSMTQSPLSSLGRTSAEPSAVLPSSAESPAVLPSSEEPAVVTIRAGETVEAAAARQAGIDARDLPAPVDEQSAPPAEVSVPLSGATAVGHSRHRPEPGLAPAERKLSSRRNGVPELEMLDSQSKPRKGVPEQSELGSPTVTGTQSSSRQTGVPDLDMLENSSKPRKGAPPPPPPDGDAAAAGTDRAFLDAAYAGPEELAGELTLDPSLASQRAVMSNLAKAHASVIVGVTFGVLSLLVLAWYGVRRVSDSWHHRHYRKMDFLVDGMYNL